MTLRRLWQMLDGRLEHEWGLASWSAATNLNGLMGVCRTIMQSVSTKSVPALGRPIQPNELNPLRLAERKQRSRLPVMTTEELISWAKGD